MRADVHFLSFGKIIVRQEDIAEIIVDENIEMDEDTVDEYHNFLVEHLKAPFSLLVNKINSYTYTFRAQQMLATIPQINCMAVVAYSPISKTATESLLGIPRNVKWNLRFFQDTEQAYLWLQERQRLQPKKHAAELN